MKRARYRLKLWSAHQETLLPHVRAKAVSLAKRTGVARADLLQEGLLAAWSLPSRAVEASADPITLQLEVAGAAMSALLEREWVAIEVVMVLACDAGAVP